MADVETVVRRLQVANLAPTDAGRGVARLPVKLMTELGLAEALGSAACGDAVVAHRCAWPGAHPCR